MLDCLPYEDGFLDGPGLPLVLPAYDVEAGVCNVVSCLFSMGMDGRGLFDVFLASFSKGPCCFPYVLLITGYVIALETVDNPTLLFFRVLVLWFHKDLFDCCIAFEMYLYTILHMCLKLSTSPFVYGITTCSTVEWGLELVVVVVLVPWLLFACVWLLLFSPVCFCCSKLLVVLLLVFCRLLLLWSSQLLYKTLFGTLLMAQGGNYTFPKPS